MQISQSLQGKKGSRQGYSKKPREIEERKHPFPNPMTTQKSLPQERTVGEGREAYNYEDHLAWGIQGPQKSPLGFVCADKFRWASWKRGCPSSS
jgi:hypothetical protein